VPKFLLLNTTSGGHVSIREVEEWPVRALSYFPNANTQITKPGNEERTFHHPDQGTVDVILIREGEHHLFTYSEVQHGVIRQKETTLSVGDMVVFCDHKPVTAPQSGKSGHSSKAGNDGAKISRWTFAVSALSDVALNWLGLKASGNESAE